MKYRSIEPSLSGEDIDSVCGGRFKNVNQAFERLYYLVNKCGEESAPRGLKIREIMNCDIFIENPCDHYIYNGFRKMSPSYIAHEFLWYLSGSREVSDISKYAKFWESIVNEDGHTVNSNYGAYMFDHNYKPIDGMSRWQYAIETLKKDRDSRQCIIQIPIIDTLGTKDVCCTSSIQFFIRNNHLNMVVHMRSNDIWKGFCSDATIFSFMQIMMANALGVSVGWYRHIVNSLHVYEPNFIENLETEDNKFMFEVREYDSQDEEDATHNRYFTSIDSRFMEDCVNLNEKRFDEITHPDIKKMMSNK